MSDAWLVVGLGNPGPEYERTRHNVGQAVLDELASRTRSSLKRHRSGARVAEVRLGTLPGGAPGPRVVLAAPTSFMNLSGGPVAGLAGYFDVDLGHVVVVHDELDVDFGVVRLKQGGGEGGHNGLRSISKSLGGKDYLRVRIGIGRPPGRQDPADFVLKEFSSAEKKDLSFLVMDGADAVEKLVADGLEAAQQKFHAPA
ncbi:MAG: aminoacyl-tRNA hydrolase [Janthinobacterium lividum]